MENNVVEELLNEMYNMIQDARSVPLSQDKCMVEREKALDLMEAIMEKWPAEVKNAQAIIASRTDLIAQARREAEGIIRKAKDQADQMITEQEIYQETKHRCEEMVVKTKDEIEKIQTAGYQFIADSLKESEETMANSLNTLQATRTKFLDFVQKNTQE